MIKRISLLITAALLVATMAMAGLAGPALAGVKSECDGQWIQSTKTCQKPLGESDNTRDTNYSNAGGGGDTTTHVNNRGNNN
jgi:hypothetical protein